MARKVWIRRRGAGAMASAQRWISPGAARARPQMVYKPLHVIRTSLALRIRYAYHRHTNMFSALHERTHLGGDPLHCFKFTKGSDRKTRLEDVNTKARQLLGYFDLFFCIQRNSRSLQRIFFSLLILPPPNFVIVWRTLPVRRLLDWCQR